MRINKFFIMCLKCSFESQHSDGLVNMDHLIGPRGQVTVDFECFKCGEKEQLEFKVAVKPPKDIRDFKKKLGLHES